MLAFFDSYHRMLPGIGVTVRSTAVKTAQGVVLICPFEFSPQQRAKISALGEVKALVFPNLHHSAYAAAVKQQFPHAVIWGVEGLEQKKPQIDWNHMLERDAWPFAGELEPIQIEGAPSINETVFYHPTTKTLIVIDLVFNMRKATGWLTPIAFRLMGSYKRFAVSKIWLKAVEDKEVFRQSLHRLLALDFTRLVMAHGEIVSTDAKLKLEAALVERDLF